MNRQQLYIVFGLVVIWYYMRKIQAANALMVRYLLPQNIRINTGAVYWNQPVVITNPTGTPINLDRYNMRVDLENYPIGTAYGTARTAIRAGGETTIMANVMIPIDALISVIPSLLNAGQSIDVRFIGHIFAELITVPVNTEIKVPIPKLFKL
ncbi:MAG TPA: LEA type 2 family protein [Dyadobacter sp.]|nr:LEA type 2 family protein [Dyadobacter sp.]